MCSLAITILLPLISSMIAPQNTGEHGVLMALFLETLYLRRQWEEPARPGLLTELAETIRRRLPGAMSHLLALITLLICCWALTDLLGLVLRGSLDALRQPSPAMASPYVHLLLNNHDFYYFLGYLLAGVSLLWRQQRARMLAMTILVMSLLYRISVDFHLYARGIEQQHHQPVPYIIPLLVIGVVRTLLSWAVTAAIIVYLARTGEDEEINPAERPLARETPAAAKAATELPWSSANYKGKLR
jgi:hypothetical protein